MNKRLLQLVKQHKRALAVLVVLHAASAMLIVSQAALFSAVVDRAHVGGETLAALGGMIALLTAVVVVRAVAAYFGASLAANIAFRIKRQMRANVIDRLSAVGPAQLVKERTGELLNTVTEGVEALEPFYRDLLPSMLHAALIPAAVLLAVLSVDALTFAVLILTAPLIPLLGALIGMAAGAQAKRRYAEMSRLSAHFFDVLQGLVTLKLFNRSAHQAGTIRRVTDAFREATMSVLKTAFLSAFMLELIATLSVAVVAVEIGVRLLHGQSDFGRALFVLVIAPEFYLPFRQLSAKFHNSANSTAAAERLFALIETPVAVPVETTHNPPALTEIRLENVTYSYTNERTALENIELTITAGQHVAVVGPTGAGKSTIIALLMRFIAPQSGKILVNGVNLQTVDPGSWRENIAYVPQRPHLFDLSIEDNIRLGKPDIPMERIIRAATLAGAHDFISALPDGYDTRCGERGLRLSGGQAQRIAIARAFLKDAPLLILDEPTAHLDAATEVEVQNALRRLCTGRTVVHIAHRLHTVTDADWIVVLEHGRIAEQGSHHRLIERDGVYTKMVARAEAAYA